jgi:hypothetical protein
MSEYFETQLREGTAQVAGSLTARPAAVVREQAERRARRVRAAVAVAASAVALVGGAAFGLARQDGRAGGAAGVSQPTATSSPTSAATGGKGTASAPDPSKYVAGAWLSQSHLPYADSITWQADQQVLGTRLAGPVQLALPGSAFFDSSVGGFGTYCSIPALSDGAVAAQLESFYGPLSRSASSTAVLPATARQSTVFYRNQGDVTAAWSALGSGFAACARFETGSVSAETATYPSKGTAIQILNEPTAQCWTNLAAVSNRKPGVTDFLDDVCFVRHGTLISNLDLGFEGPSTLSATDFSAVNAPVVSELERMLNAYDG